MTAAQLGQRAGRVDDVLEIVQEQQQRPVGNVLGKTVLRAERLCHFLEHKVRVTQRRERHPEHTVRVPVGRLGGGLEAEPGLSGSARTGQRQQAGVREQAEYLPEFVLTTEERRRGDRQVRPVKALQRRKLPLPELVQALRSREILQTVLAEVAKQISSGQGGGRGRDEHLAAVATRSDASRAMHVNADVALFVQVGGARVDADAHANSARSQPRQRFAGRLERIRRRREATKNASPCVSTSTPPWAAQARRRM